MLRIAAGLQIQRSGGNFDYDTPITRELVTGYVLQDIKEKFTDYIKDKELSQSDFSKVGEFTSDIPFSPDHAGLWKSIYRHIKSNSTQFTIGGANFKVEPTINKNWFNVTIDNPMSKNSLFLHLSNNKESGKFRTTTQTFGFSMKVDENIFKSDDEN